MFTVDDPALIHEIAYRSSGASAPRDLTLEVCTVRYRSDRGHSPTFLATADLQGRETGKHNRLLGELVADELIALQELGELPAFDMCVLCGDFYDYPDHRKLGGTGDVTTALNALSRTASQTFAVLGNHDEVDVNGLRSEIRILDGEVVTTDTFTIGGVSGIVGNPRKNNRKPESDFLSAVDKCSNSRTDLLLLHQGPQGSTDAARGSELINHQLQRRSNLLVLFGHCHWPAPFYNEGQNLFCNVDARVLAFIPESETTTTSGLETRTVQPERRLSPYLSSMFPFRRRVNRGVIATDIMPEYQPTPIAEVKQRLIDGMIEFIDGDPELPDDDFDCGYTRADVDRCSSIIDAYLSELAANNGAGEAAIILTIKKAVLQLNELNDECGGGLIETDQREDLCELLLVAARQNGLSTTDDVTEEWREW